MKKNYTDVNSSMIDAWAKDGWIWGQPISHADYLRAQNGEWEMLLTPVRRVPKDWYPKLRGTRVLGLACGGAQQMPIFAALGAKCTVLDYSQKQLDSEREVSLREGYEIDIVRADMTKPLPFEDESFELIFHPVSNCYIKDVCALWRECFRVLKHGGVLLAGFDNGVGYAFNDEGTALEYPLPFDPLSDEALYRRCIDNDWGIQFSHTVDEQIGGQLRAGFTLLDVYQDTDGEGRLHEYNVPTMLATRARKP